MTWHGLEDQPLSFKNIAEYWERVKDGNTQIDDYYRLFASPGTQHCMPGSGWYPGDAMDSLVDWVERALQMAC